MVVRLSFSSQCFLNNAKVWLVNSLRYSDDSCLFQLDRTNSREIKALNTVRQWRYDPIHSQVICIWTKTVLVACSWRLWFWLNCLDLGSKDGGATRSSAPLKETWAPQKASFEKFRGSNFGASGFFLYKCIFSCMYVEVPEINKRLCTEHWVLCLE